MKRKQKLSFIFYAKENGRIRMVKLEMSVRKVNLQNLKSLLVIVCMMSVVLKFLYHSLIQAIFETTQFKTPSGTYDPIWLISSFLNTAYEDKVV